MRLKRHILFLVYDGLHLLDMAGPAAAFAMANRLADADLYDVRSISPLGGAVTCEGGLIVQTVPMRSVPVMRHDTVLVMGAEAQPLRRALADQPMIDWIKQAASRAERCGSVCTGTFLLAAAGLLDGRAAATHWEGCDALRRSYPQVRVDPDALYVVDGQFWTSAGMTTGLDMALAMIKADHGATLMGAVAKRMVVYAHRPGSQSQFSSLLDAQTADRGGFADVIDWIGAMLDQPLKVDQLARRAGMSERSFQRKFTASIGRTPAKFVEDMRVERAKQLLEAGQLVKEVAGAVGFRSEAAFRASFQDHLGISPSMHRLVHRKK